MQLNLSGRPRFCLMAAEYFGKGLITVIPLYCQKVHDNLLDNRSAVC